MSRPAAGSTGPSCEPTSAVRRLTLPDAEEAHAATGYERYTITPFGSRRAWPVILDESAIGYERVSVGGGAPGVNIHVAPGDLVRVLAATVVDVSMVDPAT